jgi:opacity protein-like surface antigen
MKKIAILMALALASFSFAADKIQPTRVGPVSYYGSLQASGGYLYGSKSGTEKVQLKGMSM